jgi:alpha-L-fucosidase
MTLDQQGTDVLPQRIGTTLYVSALGDNSDGSSWAHAFRTVQAALGAIPDDLGGHRIVIRPDTYMEGNLHPAHRGAEGSYNYLVVDWDGSLGSGTSRYAVVDASDAVRGMQSVDWWGFPRCTPDFSGVTWDRWVLRHIYATGGDGGLFWDLPFKIEEFSIIVEDSVGIGRAFGGGAGHFIARPEEPIVYRRCNLWSLDWWGDTAGVYVRAENPEPTGRPDVYLEDCTLVGPQCALKSGNPGFDTYSHVSLDRCRLIALNFSQPHGTPTDGIIQSVMEGKYLHVDMRDTTLMGYKVFGVRDKKETANDIGCTTSGCVQAYVQYEQDVPEGIHTMGHWPVDAFQYVSPPSPTAAQVEQRPTPLPGKDEIVRRDMCEVSPFMWEGRLHHLFNVRTGEGVENSHHHLSIVDVETDTERCKFAELYNLASVIVEGNTLYVYASRWENDTWKDVTLFQSTDLLNWEMSIVITQDQGEGLFNTSVCKGPDGYVMAYETSDPAYPAFSTKYAVSDDLVNWKKLPNAVFGTDRYAACPCIRYENGYYYQLYLERRAPRWFFETYVVRSRDLVTWELSASNPVVTPVELDDGINTSDPEIIEIEGTTYLYYSSGDQLTWMNAKRRAYHGSMAEFFESWFRQPPVPDTGTLGAEHERAMSRREWFREAKFGLFIHWGLYCAIGKNDDNEYVSWVMEHENIGRDEYARYADQFAPDKFDPHAWMQMAKDAGMRYVVFTSKHHEGYSMFESGLSNYTSEKTAPGRDFVRELMGAARTAGLKIGFYYSFLDWYHEDYQNDLDRYVTQFAHGQVRELCTNYGPIDAIWFDGEWDHPAETWHAEDLVRMIRQLQPDAVINDRLGKDERGVTQLSDFYTREQMIEIGETAGFERDQTPWEACMTIGRSWGYRVDDEPHQSSDELIRTLVDVACRGGNTLLNVGPKPSGEIPSVLTQRLADIGAWMRHSGESIYGTRRFNMGDYSCTAKESHVYVHLTQLDTKSIDISDIGANVVTAQVMATSEELVIDSAAKVILLAELPNEPVVTIEITLDSQVGE